MGTEIKFLHLLDEMKALENEKKWHVVYVSSRQEKKAARMLLERGVENYLPLSKRLQQWSDRKKWVEFPMFNGYLFVRPESDQIEDIPRVPGIVNFLKFNKALAVVTDKEIEIIKTIETAGYHAESLHTPGEFEKGDKVLVMEGPLKGQVGQLLRKNNEQVFLISFETLGQSIKVSLPYDLLKLIEETA